MVLQPMWRESLRSFRRSRRLPRRSGGTGLREILQRRNAPHLQEMRLHRSRAAKVTPLAQAKVVILSIAKDLLLPTNARFAHLMNNHIRQLTKLAAAYRAAEEAVVRAFFNKPRTKKDHLRWLKAQGFKEYSAIKPIIDALTAL